MPPSPVFLLRNMVLECPQQETKITQLKPKWIWSLLRGAPQHNTQKFSRGLIQGPSAAASCLHGSIWKAEGQHGVLLHFEEVERRRTWMSAMAENKHFF